MFDMRVDSHVMHSMTYTDHDDLEDDMDDSLGDASTGHLPSTKIEMRKSQKPIMEKRRRARINNCLNELKGILLEAMRKDPARHSKLEKADILELTVRHLQNIQRNQLAIAMATDPTVLHRFKNGFAECASEVSRYMGKLDGVDTGVKHRLTGHLGACVNGLQQVGPVTFAPPRYSPMGMAFPQGPPVTPTMGHMHPSPPVGLMSPQGPMGSMGDVNNNSRFKGGPTVIPPATVTSGTFPTPPGRAGLGSAFTSIQPRRLATPPPSPPTSSSFHDSSSDTGNISVGSDSSLSMQSFGDTQNEKGTNTTISTGMNLMTGAPIDFSIKREGKEKLGPRVVKVEPLPIVMTSESQSKDSMWRPW